MSNVARAIPSSKRRREKRKEQNKENIPLKKLKNENPETKNTVSDANLQQTENLTERTIEVSNDSTAETQQTEDANLTEESNADTETQTSSKNTTKNPKQKAKTEAQNQARQLPYIEGILSSLWDRHKCSSFNAVVIDGHIHIQGYGAYAHLSNNKEMDALLRKTVEKATTDNTLNDLPVHKTVPVKRRAIRHDWRHVNVHEKKKIYKNVILWNEAGGITGGKNLDYDVLEYAVKGWWPVNLVGGVAYPKDMDVEKLNTVIASYMKALASANWRTVVGECRAYLDGEALPSDLTYLKDGLKVYVELISPVSLPENLVTDIVPAIGRKHPSVPGENVFDAISTALFGTAGKDMVPLVKVAVVLYQIRKTEMSMKMIETM